MKVWKKITVVVLALSMLVVSMVGCGEKKDTESSNNTSTPSTTTEVTSAPEKVEVQDVTLKVWATEEEQEVTASICDEFAKAHPEYNVTFEYGVMGNDAVCDELKKDLDVAADVFVFPSAAIPELTASGILYPITLDADTVKEINGEGAVTACSKDGYLYGVPETPNSWFMYYNKSMFNETEVQNLDTMLAKDLGADVKNFSVKISDSWYMSSFFYALNGTLYGEDGLDPLSCSWNDANGMKVGKYLIDLSKNPKYLENLDGVGDSLFKEGKLGAVCSGTWSAADYKAALGENYAATKLPTITVDGTDYQLSNFADFKAFGVKSSTKYPQAAQQLAVWLGNEQSQLARYQAITTAPTVKSLATNEIVAADLAVTALLNQSNYSTPQPATPQLSEYWTPAIAFGTGIINGDITEANLQESLDAMVTGITTPAVQE
ncbi:MAG: extracellular solute-binding protein family 1 [Firmicutes bacterium]|nr:extracellular solute-binding protein family 1 [Bacillota bacterium]